MTSVALIAALTLAPMGGDGKAEVSELNDVAEAFRETDMRFLLDFMLEAIANIVLFVPFGAALSMRGYSIIKTAGYGLVVATAVEGAQWLLIPGRTTSLDDLMLNALGAVVGHALLSRLLPTRAG